MLTKQEKKVADLVCIGFSDKEVADVLCVSTRTVVNHKQNIFQKLGVNKSTELTAWYWCTKLNTQFDLKELKKQAIVLIFIGCIIPTIYSFDHSVFRYGRVRTSRAKTEIRIEWI